jgi:hypothetical protein
MSTTEPLSFRDRVLLVGGALALALCAAAVTKKALLAHLLAPPLSTLAIFTAIAPSEPGGESARFVRVGRLVALVLGALGSAYLIER